MEAGRFFYGVGRLDLHIPHSRSLKDKRAVITSLKHRLADRGKVSVIDVGPQDFWQRGTLGITLLARDEAQVRAKLSGVLRTVEEDDRVIILDYTTHIGCLDDEIGEGDL